MEHFLIIASEVGQEEKSLLEWVSEELDNREH